MNLYFMGAGDPDGEIIAVKIGYAANAEKRRKAIQAGCPYPMWIMRTIEGAGPFEPKVQAIFEKDRMWGDWFHATNELLAFIIAITPAHFDFLTREIYMPQLPEIVP